MMPLYLFRRRNFTVGNLTTLALYAGLGVATFFLIVFLQQVGGYTPIQAGLALLPLTVVTFLLARRFATLADRLGPHYFMGGGPIVAGAGLLLLARTNASADYVSQILPGVLVFAFGLAATVAPLTATVLGSVDTGHSGLASGINNAVSRVASLLAIAAIGAVVANAFAHRLDSNLRGHPLSPQAAAVVAQDRTRALVTTVSGVPPPERAEVHAALVNASVYAFRVSVAIAAGLSVLGGLVALAGIENPRRKVPCTDCPGGALAAGNADIGRTSQTRAPQPVTASPAR
jgi:hypothetical protein